MEGAALGTMIAVLVGTLVVFLVCREIVCWYWKINEGLKLLQSIDAALRWQNARLATQDQHSQAYAASQTPSWTPPQQPRP